MPLGEAHAKRQYRELRPRSQGPLVCRKATIRREHRDGEIRYRDRARSQDEADPRGRGETRHPRRRHLLPYGTTKAKISIEFINALKSRQDGKLILVTAINPTPAGEGKTTTTVGLGDGLNRIGKKAIICLREPRSARASA